LRGFDIRVKTINKGNLMTTFTKFRKEVYSGKSVIWRYMDFSKFTDLLDSRYLFFPRLSILRKLDPYEGSLVPFDSRYKKGESSEIVRESDKGLPNDVFVSCWYLSDVESAALWRLMTKSDEGIAIKSTIEKLANSIESKNSEKTIYMGSVAYGHEKVRSRKDNNSNYVSGDDVVFTKRRCFEHEKELRLVIYAYDLIRPVPRNKTGLKLEANLESMISEIIISPEAPCWMEDLVKRVTKKYGFSFEIRQSNLNKLTF